MKFKYGTIAENIWEPIICKDWVVIITVGGVLNKPEAI